MEVRALRVGHDLKALLPHRIPWLQIGKSVIGIATVAARRLSHTEVRVTCVVCLMVSSSSLLMTVPIHGSSGLRGIITLTSHLSRPWAIDMRQW
jgi:hypothetical protein